MIIEKEKDTLKSFLLINKGLLEFSELILNKVLSVLKVVAH